LCGCGCGLRTKLAPRTVAALGWVRDMPIRYVVGHNKRRRNVRFIAGVDFAVESHGYSSDCWIWKHARSGDYGCTWQTIAGNRHAALAHRLSYEHHVGAIPSGLVIDHLCDTKLCVNPDHLQAVTSGETAGARSPAAKAGGHRVPDPASTVAQVPATTTMNSSTRSSTRAITPRAGAG
jgi:hypothetical protein